MFNVRKYVVNINYKQIYTEFFFKYNLNVSWIFAKTIFLRNTHLVGTSNISETISERNIDGIFIKM